MLPSPTRGYFFYLISIKFRYDFEFTKEGREILALKTNCLSQTQFYIQVYKATLSFQFKFYEHHKLQIITMRNACATGLKRR